MKWGKQSAVVVCIFSTSIMSKLCCLLDTFQFLSETKSGLLTQVWKHRDCDYSFQQQMNMGNRTWNTGVFGVKLKCLANGNIKVILKGLANANINHISNFKSIRACAAYILRRRAQASTTYVTTSGKGYFPFEEDIDHQIREAVVICTTGVSTSFFSNPYVKDLLRNLEPRHRTVYRKKLTRIVRCIMDVSQSEVCIICIFAKMLYVHLDSLC